MNKIFALTDYKGQFGSKWGANPYRSGLDKDLVKQLFKRNNCLVEFVPFFKVNLNDNWSRKLVIYTSSEEPGLFYKSFIEDIIFALERSGAILIPRYDFLKANNNKIYMEILRDRILGKQFNKNSSLLYGTLEELKSDVNLQKVKFPCVIKPSSGSMSKGVYLAYNEDELIKRAKKISRTGNIHSSVKEFYRILKYKGYTKESFYQKKFIVQDFIHGLSNDWKIIIYGDHYYVLKRGIRKNDFRASGSHFNYSAGSKSEFPIKLLNIVKAIYQKMDIPHLSLDFAFDGEEVYVHEFQGIYFGTSTMEFSSDYYFEKDGTWLTGEKTLCQEEEYVLGILKYLDKHVEFFK